MEEIEKDLLEFKEDMLNWRMVLNQEGIWLFLATLGSWSVPRGWLQFFAFLIVLFLFFWRATSQMKNRISFPQRSKNLRDKINKEIDDEIKKKAFLYDLLILDQRNNTLQSLKSAVPYMLSIIFWLASFWYFLYS